MRVVQLTSPDTPGTAGFSPRPMPRLIATHRVKKGGSALAISKGVDRDRSVDESGSQISVFGRVGAGPLTLEEQHRMYLNNNQVWKVSDDPFDDEVYRWLPKDLQPPLGSPKSQLQQPLNFPGALRPAAPVAPIRR
jgi:hypothetical protein